VSYDQLRQPERRDPRGYVLPADQPDFLTATKVINTLIRNGVSVLRAKTPFNIGDKKYPAGSYVVKTAQAFRPHILDMFEPQDHPNDYAYPGAPPTAPYDSAGWTLAYQMGVRFDRIRDAFEGPFEPITGDLAPPPGTISQVSNPAGFLFTHQANDAFVAVNRLLRSGEGVYWLTSAYTAEGRIWPAGTHYVAAGRDTLSTLQQLARDVGLSFQAVSRGPQAD